MYSLSRVSRYVSSISMIEVPLTTERLPRKTSQETQRQARSNR
jgi:hypothetical protein